MTLSIRPLPEVLGAEITGIDLGQPLAETDFAAIRSALEDRQVLVFRDQHITPDQHIDFSRRFGPLEIHVQHHFHLGGHPEVLIVSNVIEDGKPIGLADAGRYWHSDLSYLREPSLGSLLHAQELPVEGGDTLFTTMFGAYENLPEDLRRRIDGLDAVHDYGARNRKQREASALRPGLTPEQENRVPAVVHPVVRVHPANGRKALFVNEGFTTHIVGLPEEQERRPVGNAVPAFGRGPFHLPAPLAAVRSGDVGQSLDAAPRDRLPAASAPDALSHHRPRRRTDRRRWVPQPCRISLR